MDYFQFMSLSYCNHSVIKLNPPISIHSNPSYLVMLIIPNLTYNKLLIINSTSYYHLIIIGLIIKLTNLGLLWCGLITNKKSGS